MTCPANPPAPAGYMVWKGAVPTELTQWAMQLRDNIAPFPYGQTWTLDYTDASGNPATVLARKDYHTWTWRNGQLVTGLCIPGVTLYAPIPGGTPTTAEAGLPPPAGDPLASADGTEAVWGADTVPSATTAPPTETSWPLVALTAGAIGGVVFLFFQALKAAGRAAGP